MRANRTNFFVIGPNPFYQRLSAFYSCFVEIVWFRIPKSARVEHRGGQKKLLRGAHAISTITGD